MAHTGIEEGFNSTITVVGDEVIKLSPQNQAYETAEQADMMVERLAAYSGELATQPVIVTMPKSIMMLPQEGGYKLRHSYELVDGPSVSSLPFEERRDAIAQILSQVSAMDTINDADTLRVPIDARAPNFHTDNRGPVLTDIFPAISRNTDGSFPLQVFTDQPRGRSLLLSWTMGTKSGAMTKLLFSALDRGDSKGAKLTHMARRTDEWCYDVLPADMEDSVRDAVRKQVRHRFVPLMARIAVDKTWAKVNNVV